jgi:hypothetical protein
MNNVFESFNNFIETSTKEESLQLFLKKHPSILIHTFNQGAHYPTVLPKFKLSDELIPDFIIIGRRSGTKYTSWDVDMIEIEPSINDRNIFTKKGLSAGRLRVAEGQITAWRQWMQSNAQAIFVPKALKKLKEKNAWDDNPHFYNPSSFNYQSMMVSYRIVIGRRSDFGDIGDKYRDIKWEESGHRIEIVPWDRLLDKTRIFILEK